MAEILAFGVLSVIACLTVAGFVEAINEWRNLGTEVRNTNGKGGLNPEPEPMMHSGAEKSGEEITTREQETTLTSLAVLAIMIGLPAWAIWTVCPDSVKYAWRYDLPRRQIEVQKKPSDCDWQHAPMGDKGCHYEKQIDLTKTASGRITAVLISWTKVND